MKKMCNWIAIASLLAAVAWPAVAAAQDSAPQFGEICGDVFQNAVGPFDYNNPDDWTRKSSAGIPIVERAHFTTEIEAFLVRDGVILNNLDYTLRAVPNHPRALNAIARFDIERGISTRRRSVDCWFERAIRFRPQDSTVWQIYANYLSRKDRHEEALDAYEQAKAIAPDRVEIDYNLGLLYVRMGQYDKALERARVAYAADYPLPGLRRKLEEKGLSVD